MSTREPRPTRTCVVVDTVQARRAVTARLGGTLVYIARAIASRKARRTLAPIATARVMACGRVTTRRRFTALVHVQFTQSSGESEWTVAAEVGVVGGGPAPRHLAARVGVTRVHLSLARAARVRRSTHTLERRHSVDTRAVVETG